MDKTQDQTEQVAMKDFPSFVKFSKNLKGKEERLGEGSYSFVYGCEYEVAGVSGVTISGAAKVGFVKKKGGHDFSLPLYFGDIRKYVDTNTLQGLECLDKEMLTGRTVVSIEDVEKEVYLSRFASSIKTPLKANPHTHHALFPIKGGYDLFLSVLISPRYENNMGHIGTRIKYFERVNFFLQLFRTLSIYINSSPRILMFDASLKNVLFKEIDGQIIFSLSDFGLSSSISSDSLGGGVGGTSLEKRKSNIQIHFESLLSFRPLLSDEGDYKILTVVLNMIGEEMKKNAQTKIEKKEEQIKALNDFYNSCIDHLTQNMAKVLKTGNKEIQNVFDKTIRSALGEFNIIKRLDELEKDVAKLKMADSPGKIKKLTFENLELKEEIKKLNIELGDVKRKLFATETELGDVKRKLFATETELGDMKNKHEKEMKDMKGRMRVMESFISTNEGDLIKLKHWKEMEKKVECPFCGEKKV